MESKGFFVPVLVAAGVTLIAGCDSGGVPKVSIDKTTVAINSIDADAEVMERDVSFVQVNYTARKSLTPDDYAITWRVVEGLEGLGLPIWTSATAFGGDSAQYPDCFGIEYAATPAATATVDPDSDDPVDVNFAFLAPPVPEARTLLVEVAVSADEGVEEERIVTATRQFEITVQPFALQADLAIADANLASCINEVIDACPYGDLGVFQLSCDTVVASLSGLDILSALQMLELSQLDNVADLAPAASLNKLRMLSLEGETGESDFSAFADLTTLNDLRLDLDFTGAGGFALSNIRTLLPELDHLELCFDDFADISLLPEATSLAALTICDTGTNGITDTSYLSQMTQLITLEYLKDRDDPENSALLVDYALFQPLRLLQNLTARSLQLPTTNIQGADLNPLAVLQNLKMLDVQSSQVADLSPLEDLTRLEELNASQNYISDISPIADLTNLQTLDLADNQIVDLTALEELNQIDTLDLSNNQILTITALQNLRLLEDLALEGNDIVSVVALGGLSRLTSLNLSANEITSDDFVENMDSLITLDLSCNPNLKSVEGIVSNATLETLTINDDLYNHLNTDAAERAALDTLNLTKIPNTTCVTNP